MNYRILLSILLSVFSLGAYAQMGGIEGKVVSREGRTPIAGVEISVEGTELTTRTSEAGDYTIVGLAAGEYDLTYTAQDFETLTLRVRVTDMLQAVNVAIMIPTVAESVVDDAIFAEYDNESGDDAQALPTSLSSSRDVFNRIAAYEFSEMRFNVRGYDSRYQDVYLNGIQFNDAITGYSPWSLWSGLNDAVRNQEITTGLKSGDVGLGGIGGVTNINTLPSQMRKGWSTSLVNSSAMYRFRAMVTYSSGYRDNGWAYAFSLSTRQGDNSYVDGVYYNTYGYFAAIEKRMGLHRLSLTFMGAPTQRGAQQASTQEAYDLAGTNYYNPNWGWQDGEMRNTRIRNNHEPIAMLNYRFDISDRTELNAASSFRFGKNGYSALTWFSGMDPRPDYYRYLPSYQLYRNNPDKAAVAYDNWFYNVDQTRHIDFDAMYNVNYNGIQEPETYGAGHRANYMIEERHADQLDFNFMANIEHAFDANSSLTAGVNFRRNATEYYSMVKDLMGGDYWVDVDKFAERDFPGVVASQNNLDYYYLYGHAPVAREGDKYGYDYYAHVMNARAWAKYELSVGAFSMDLGGELGHTTLWREGLWKKGLFPENSKGDSQKQNYLTYKIKTNFAYQLGGAHKFEFSTLFSEDAPEFQSAFISPRTRNSATPGIETEKVRSADLSYSLNYAGITARLSGYYTYIQDQSRLMSYYDDVQSSYTNFAMSGIDKEHYGLEFAASIPLTSNLSFNTAVSWGTYKYASNANYVQVQDNSGETVSQGKIYWKDFYVESTPQTAINAGLSYRSDNNLYVSLDFNFYNDLYLSMSPLYRTDDVITPSMPEEAILAMRAQEQLLGKDGAYTLGASVGKNWYLTRTSMLGLNFSVSNMLNNQNIRTGGYEQLRLLDVENSATGEISYEPFGSKYFYLLGTTYYLNIYYRF